MGWLRDRVENKEARLAAAVQHARLVEEFDRRASRLVWMDERDEVMQFDGQTDRSSLNAEKRGIERLWTAYEFAERAVYGTCDHAWYPQVQEYFRVIEHHDQIRPRGASRQQWDKDRRTDVIENFLYQEYLEQLDTHEPIRTFPAYAMYVCAKAVIELLTTHRGGGDALRRIHPSSQPFPMRSKAILFKDHPDYAGADPQWFMSRVFAEVPGVWEAVQTLQLHYGDVVRAEHETVEDAGILPDDPFGATLAQRYKTPQELRMEAAVEAFKAGEGTGDQLAKVYSVPRDKLRAELRERGLAKWGGDRFAKKEI